MLAHLCGRAGLRLPNLDRAARWTRLRPVGNSLPAKLTILIPLIGYLIIFNAKVAKYLHLVRELSGYPADNQLPVSPRLLLVYFGLCALALGQTMFSLGCPAKVKHYGDPAAFAGGDGPSTKDFAFERIETELKNSAYRMELKTIHDRYGPAQTNEQKSQVNNSVLHLYFEYLDNLHPLMRWIAFLSYAIGFICLMIPSLGVFFRVVDILWSALTTNPRLFF